MTASEIVHMLARIEPHHRLAGRWRCVMCYLPMPDAPTVEDHRDDCPWRLAIEWSKPSDEKAAS